MQIIAAKTPRGNYPQTSQVISRIRNGNENQPGGEICLFHLHERLHLFAVTNHPVNMLSRLRDYLPEISPWFTEPVTNRQAIRQFFELYLGKDSSLAGEKSLRSDLDRDLRESRTTGLTGAVFRKLQRAAGNLVDTLWNTTDVNSHSVTPEALSLELTGKIVENVSEAIITIIEDPQSSDQFLDFWNNQSAHKIYYCTTNFSAIERHILNTNVLPVQPEELNRIIPETDAIIIASSHKESLLKTGEFLYKRMKQKKKHLLVFNWENIPGLHDLASRSSSVFAYDKNELENALQQGLAKRQQIISRFEPQLEDAVNRFFEWFHSDKRFQFHGMIGISRPMQQVFDLVQRVAETDITVLIQGETGTGKELVARAIHKSSQRKNGQFVAINCGAIPETLLESELFGHEKGAFTGASEPRTGLLKEAAGGTVFLDEIGETSKLFQVKLLRALQEREITPLGSSVPESIDVRIIAATSKQLQDEVEEDRFRPDLYYRINVVKITLPSLRERTEDILPLARHFMERQNRIFGKRVEKITEEATQALTAYAWPGNVRELENVIERAMALIPGDTISADELPPAVKDPSHASQESKDQKVKTLEEMEKEYIEELLREYPGNYNQVAELLGIGRTTLWRKMKKYDLERE